MGILEDGLAAPGVCQWGLAWGSVGNLTKPGTLRGSGLGPTVAICFPTEDPWGFVPNTMKQTELPRSVIHPIDVPLSP